MLCALVASMAAGVALAPAAGAQTPQSSDATLFSLSIESDIAQTRMFPAFDPAVERYDVAVPSGETEVTVKVKTNDPGASAVLESTRSGRCCIEELDYDANTDAYTLELRTDRYTYMTIKVTAANGTEKQYDMRIDVASRDEKGWRVYNDVPMDRLVDEPQFPSHYIRGLWADDSRVLTTARRHGTKDGEVDLDQKLYAFDAADSSRLPDEEFVLSGRPHAGIWSDGTTLWALDTDGTLRAYDLSDGSEITGWSVDLSPDGYYDTREVYEPRGIWSDGDTLWVTGKDDADNAKGFAFELPKGCNSCRKSSLDFELSGDNDNPWGITGNADTWWVTEVGEGGWTTDARKIYAYNRSDGTRDADKDIDLSQLNIGNIQQLYYGLAATDTIMYVAEYITGRVYSFSMPGVSGSVAPALNSSDATLSSLSLTDVSPDVSASFDSRQTVYYGSVAHDVTSTTVTATVNVSLASYEVKYGATDVIASNRVVPLAEYGDHIIKVAVTAQDGTTNTYRVTVTKLRPSADATLSGLSLSGVPDATLGFSSEDVDYDVDVANGLEETTVSFVKNHAGATVVVNKGGVEDADRVVPLDVDENEITVVVTAEDGQTIKTYTVTVDRAEPPLSTDATLSALSLSGVPDATLGFSSEDVDYDVDVANGLEETTVSFVKNHAGATVVVNKGGVEDADQRVPLDVGENEITVVVTAENGLDADKKTYTVTVDRAEPPPSTDATLSALSLSGVPDATLGFSSEDVDYDVDVANGLEETTVSFVKNHAGATVVVNKGGVEDADRVVPLDVGENEITVVVTAENGLDADKKTYTVTVNRAASGSQPPVNSNPGTYNPGTYNPGTYNPGTYNPGTYNPGTYNPGGGSSNTGSSTVGESSGDAADSDSEADGFTPLDDAADAGTDTEAAINALHRLGVFTGTLCQSNRLCPNDPLQRWIAAVWLVRLIDGDDPAAVTESRFEDVNASSMWEESVWYAPHVERLADLEITVGCTQDPLNFCPDVNLPRAQVASWLARAFDLESDESQGFVDAVGSAHEANINAVVAAGVMSGCSTSPKNFCLTDTVTKGEMARYVYAARNVSLGLS